MFTTRAVLLTLELLNYAWLGKTWEYNFPEDWKSQWTQNSQSVLGADENCVTSHMTAYEVAKAGTDIRFSTSPLDDFEAPRTLPLNSSSGEQWEFDGVSDDGMISFIFGFYRDPSLSLMGSGNFRLSAELAYANGTRFGRVDYAAETTIQSCPDGTKGVWKSKDFSYTFEISKDMSRLRLGMDTPDLKGNIFMTSKTLPRYADAKTFPSDSASTEAAPHFHWVDPIPVGDVKVDLTVKGGEFAWEGSGGHTRIWATYNWYTCLMAMDVVRMKAGPYSLFYSHFKSRISDGQEYASAFLMKDGETIFSTTVGEVSESEDYVRMTKTYDGTVYGTLRDKVTGYELELISPRRKKHWTFIMEHKNIAFEYLIGKGRGGSGFSSSSSGGPVGLEQFRGVALTEALNFPDTSPLFKNQYVK